MRLEDFWSHVAVAGPDDCWPWLGYRDSRGYGQLHIDGRRRHQDAAYRVAFLLSGRTLTSGEQVNHLCNNPPCCNPAHLSAGTQRDNMRQMVRDGRCRPWKAGRAHCFRGHAFTPENTLENKRGNRQCRTCLDVMKASYDIRRQCNLTRPWRIITDEMAAQIVARYRAGGASQKVIAQEFGISRPSVSRIVTQAAERALAACGRA